MTKNSRKSIRKNGNVDASFRASNEEMELWFDISDKYYMNRLNSYVIFKVILRFAEINPEFNTIEYDWKKEVDLICEIEKLRKPFPTRSISFPPGDLIKIESALGIKFKRSKRGGKPCFKLLVKSKRRNGPTFNFGYFVRAIMWAKWHGHYPSQKPVNTGESNTTVNVTETHRTNET